MSLSGSNGSKGFKGNTNIKPLIKRISPSKNWCFTFNNYDEGSLNSISKILIDKNISYVIGKEIGESGTPHLQGFIKSPRKIRPDSLKLCKSIHWEKSKGSVEDNIKYCTKDGNAIYSNDLRPLQCLSVLYEWQSKIEQFILSNSPDGRTVNWLYDLRGGKGKSAFCKYMFIRHNCLTIQGGKLADIMNIIFNTNMRKVQCVFIDIPRCNSNKISYSAIECILNGMITNTKFETGVKVFNPPHIYVFANFEPDYEKLSHDRWHVSRL